jgi:hypothetical protein
MKESGGAETREGRSAGAALVARRYAQMTPDERSAAASNAARARWAGHVKAGKKGKKKGKK